MVERNKPLKSRSLQFVSPDVNFLVQAKIAARMPGFERKLDQMNALIAQVRHRLKLPSVLQWQADHERVFLYKPQQLTSAPVGAALVHPPSGKGCCLLAP